MDGIKALLKEQTKPLRNIAYLFLLSPFICLVISLLLITFLTFNYNRSYFDEFLNLIFFICIASFNVFGVILAG